MPSMASTPSSTPPPTSPAICWARTPTTLLDLRHTDRRRIHNLKYYTWVEQQGKTYEEILAQREDPTYWTGVQGQVEAIDALIEEFNAGESASTDH